ncbi:hypothetical protein J6590_104800 [Homalodisca vitripennis]|nr:hypothetical protein J6590_002480 [Homalodisca vitripennis]KAG8323902.1 hypothetical protein J6590_104800 [Homalodisca vitripennis]
MSCKEKKHTCDTNRLGTDSTPNSSGVDWEVLVHRYYANITYRAIQTRSWFNETKPLTNGSVYYLGPRLMSHPANRGFNPSELKTADITKTHISRLGATLRLDMRVLTKYTRFIPKRRFPEQRFDLMFIRCMQKLPGKEQTTKTSGSGRREKVAVRGSEGWLTIRYGCGRSGGGSLQKSRAFSSLATGFTFLQPVISEHNDFIPLFISAKPRFQFSKPVLSNDEI